MTSPDSAGTGANDTDVPVIDQCLALMADGGYFVRREPGEGAQAEYWDAKKDPDGNLRDIESERPQRVEDLRYIAEFVNALPAGRVLDIGCGLGELLQQVDVRHEAYGLDTSPRSVEICREKTRAEVLLGVLEGAFVEEGWFDAAVAHHVIEHVDEPVPFVREVFRLLKPGGAFILVDTIQYGDEPGLDTLLENFPRGFHEPYYDSYCRADLTALFDEASLRKCDETVAFLTKATLFERPRSTIS